MSDNCENEKSKSCGDTKISSPADGKSESAKESQVAGKKPYTKPTLRKFSQIDYVTAYGID